MNHFKQSHVPTTSDARLPQGIHLGKLDKEQTFTMSSSIHVIFTNIKINYKLSNYPALPAVHPSSTVNGSK